MARSSGMSEEKIETFDAKKGVGILSGQPPSSRALGPYRKAPLYYAGETYGRRHIQYPDVVRYPNGALPSTRNKAARRVIRAALKRKFSKVETALVLPRAMKMQARELASERTEKIADYHNGNRSTYFASTSGDTRFARRLYAQELAIHEPVYAPSSKELRAMRTAKRKLKRQGKPYDAISSLVDKMAGEKR